MSNPVGWEQDVTRSPAAPYDDWVALCPRVPAVGKSTKRGVFVVANVSLKKYKKIRWCKCLY